MKRLLALLALAGPVYGQYAGPAILSRGEAPSAMAGNEIKFRPFVEVDAVYSTGLSGVTLNSQGNIANEVSAGIEFAGGVSGSHRWRHTTLGLSYRGDYNHYFRFGGADSSDHSLLLGLVHQFSRHVAMSWSNNLGIINRDYGLLSTLSQAVPFDPSQNYVPNTDFFNNRTIFYSSNLGVIYQKTTRLSFSMNGGYFTTLRDSQALYNATGISARGDIQYRVNRVSTVGVLYSYDHYGYSQLISNTNVHGAALSYARRLSRLWEASGYAGFARVESKFIQDVPVDPTIAAIIGITESPEVVYSVQYIPNVAARISRTFERGVLSAQVQHGVNPGNGLFLTSTSTIASIGYTYTGLRRWSFAVNMADQMSKSIGNVYGNYDSQSMQANVSRTLGHGMNAVAGFTTFRYKSSDFARYNQWVYAAHVGFGWSPGEIPLRIW